MSNPNTQAKVKSTLTKGETVAAALSSLDAVCSAGAQCAEVQASPIATNALAVLQKAVTAGHAALSQPQQLAQALTAAIKALNIDVAAIRVATHTYEAAVESIAQGNAGVINRAGLQSRAQSVPQMPLGPVSVVHTKPGKSSAEAIVTWPRGPGATGYAIEVNFTPQSPTGPWTAITSGTGRRRIIKAPTPGAQFLVQVASLGAGGTQSAWSDPILAVAAF